jgi:hypothetical protein
MITQTTGRHLSHAATARLLLLLSAILAASAALAGEPRLVPFQARLTDVTGADLNGVYRITFAIYDEPTGGTALWSEIHPSVSVVDGRVNVPLGSIKSLNDYPRARTGPGRRDCAEVDRFFRAQQVHRGRAHYQEGQVMQRQINIVSAVPAGDYRLRLAFDDGTEQTVDFLPFLSRSHHPDIRAFLEQQRFLGYRVEHGDLIWGDYDLCFPILDLYYNRILHAQAEESAA